MKQKEWFASWFDSKYYHILYDHRNEGEAAIFIENLCEKLELPQGAKVLDLACGKGRHSITLHKLGFNVTGADLSENSIEKARLDSNNTIEFLVHDMRTPILGRNFDAVLNLFTSFGYFDSSLDNEKVLRAVSDMLVPEGVLVLDFLNANKAIELLTPKTSISKAGIDFSITKRYDGSHIFKRIEFEDEGTKFDFEERVQALTISDFKELLNTANFDILTTFGDFALNPFDSKTSDRLIIVAKKR